MKVAIIQLFLDISEINAPIFACNIDCGSNSPSPVNQNVPPKSDIALQPDFKSDQDQLPPTLSNRPPPTKYPHLI